MTLINQIKSIFSHTNLSLDDLIELPLEDSFLSLSVNKDEFKGTLHNRMLTIQGKSNCSFCLGLGESDVQAEVNGKTIDLSKEQDLIKANKIFDKIFLWMREKSIFYVKEGDAQAPVNVQAENEAMEWLRVSLLVLKKSFTKIKSDKNLVFETRIFFGTPPHQEFPILRIQCLSLDFLIEFLPSHVMRLRVWNYKDNQKDSTGQEDLKVDLIGLKAPVLEEFIVLFNEMRPLILI